MRREDLPLVREMRVLGVLRAVVFYIRAQSVCLFRQVSLAAAGPNVLFFSPVMSVCRGGFIAWSDEGCVEGECWLRCQSRIQKKVFRDIENFPDESLIFPMGDSIAILLAVIIPSVSAINLDPTGLEWTNRPNGKKEETLGDLQTTEKHGAKRQ